MKKRKIALSLLSGFLLFLGSCASGSGGNNLNNQDSGITNIGNDDVIIDHKGRAVGMAMDQIPEWISVSVLEGRSALQRLFPGDIAFVADQNGSDLRGLKMWVDNFEIQGEFSKQLATEVETKFRGRGLGNQDSLGTAMSNAVNVTSNASFSGLRKEGDWWVKTRHFNAAGDVLNEDYTYYVLYLMDKALFDQQFQQIVNQAGDSLSPEDKQVMDLLMAEVAEEGFGL